MNVTVESLKKQHGDKAAEVYKEIADKGGFGDVPMSYEGGLDVAGVLTDANTSLSSSEKDRIAELAGVDRGKATDLAEKGVGGKSTADKKAK